MTNRSPLRMPPRGAQSAVAASPRGHVASAAGAVEAELRFVAYAAHELRGSIALLRTLAEVALADADADRVALREMGERVVAACERQECLLEACLTLVRGRGGLQRCEPVDLAVVAAGVLRAHDRHGLRVNVALEPAWATGDPHLLERLIANLVANGICHNVRGGRLDVATGTAAGRAIFTIANTGPVIPTGELSRLFQPFQRLESSARFSCSGDGVGLGLAIVQAIADAHDAALTAQARSGGGLRIDVALSALD